jgi:hypothetical protein
MIPTDNTTTFKHFGSRERIMHRHALGCYVEEGKCDTTYNCCKWHEIRTKAVKREQKQVLALRTDAIQATGLLVVHES